MYLKKFWSNIHGMSLTEMMIGIGLLGGISLVTMKAMQDQAGNESYLKWSAAVNKAAMDIQTMMNNSARCNEMFAGVERQSGSWPNLNPFVSLTALMVKKSATESIEILRADKEYAEGFYIPANGIQLGTSANGSGITELVLTFKTRNKAQRTHHTVAGSANQGTIIKRIPFVTTLDGNRIRSCGPVVADEDVKAKELMCKSLGGAAEWDDDTKTCNLLEVKCPEGQVPTQMNSLGHLHCTPINNEEMRNQLFDFSSTTCPPGQGVTLTVGAAGKIKAGCTGTATGCPAMSNLTWYSIGASGSQCSGSVTAGSFGNTRTVNDSVGPATGSASFICDASTQTWVLQSSPAPTCVDNSLSCAAGVDIYWSGATKFCEGKTTAVGNAGAVQNVPSTAGGSGTAEVECVAGKWSIRGTPSCN